MRKPWFLILASLFLILICGDIYGQVLVFPDETLPLNIPMHLSQTLANWDSVWAKIRQGGVKFDSVKLSVTDAGDYYGSIALSSYTPGPYYVLYCGYYSSYVMCDQQGFTVLNVDSLQGEASGLAAQDIIDLMAEQGWFTGIGAYSCTVYTKLSDDSSSLGGVKVIVKNADESSPVDHGWTDVNGMMVFHLDSMAVGLTYKFWLMDVDYGFSIPESADVGSDTGLTFYGSAFDYGDPPADSQTAIVGQVFNPFLDSLSGVKVMAKVLVPTDEILHYHGYPITPFEVGDTTEADGRFRLDLIPNSSFGPTGTKYIFNFLYPLRDAKYFIKADTVIVPYSSEPVQYGDIKGR